MIDAQRALLAFHSLLVAVAAAQLVLLSASVLYPRLHMAAMIGLGLAIAFVRLRPAGRRRPQIGRSIEVGSMTIAVTLLITASGAARSPLLPLFILPLAAMALAFGRVWLVLLHALVVGGLGLLLGVLTPGVVSGSMEFRMELLASLLPGTSVALLLAAAMARMNDAVDRVGQLAATDALTGLLNLHGFEAALQQEHRRAERFGRTFTLIFVGVDDLAQTRDTLGEEASSAIVSAVASAVGRSIRGTDISARLSRDEFVVLCSEADPQTAAAIAQRIRNNVYAGTVSVANRLVRANVSVGVAGFPADHLYPKELMMLASKRMQQDRELRRPQQTTG